MKLAAAAIQMRSEPFDVPGNLDRADALLDRARRSGVELAVLPELFNAGYAHCADYGPFGEGRDGRTVRHLRARAREWGMAIAAGFVEREGRHVYNTLAYCGPTGELAFYRKRHLVFWEPTRFRRGREPLIVATPWGRIGFAICADMIYARIWGDYRGRIDLAVVAAAWPQFACRESGRKHWLLGRVGPLSAEIPGIVARDLDIPVVFANQAGETRTRIPLLRTRLADRFAGRSSICDGRHGPPLVAGVDEEVLISTLTIHPPRGPKSCHTTYHSASEASSSVSERP